MRNPFKEYVTVESREKHKRPGAKRARRYRHNWWRWLWPFGRRWHMVGMPVRVE